MKWPKFSTDPFGQGSRVTESVGGPWLNYSTLLEWLIDLVLILFALTKSLSDTMTVEGMLLEWHMDSVLVCSVVIESVGDALDIGKMLLEW